jgi:hypothetical protein
MNRLVRVFIPIILLMANGASAENNPLLSWDGSYLLSLPLVDYAEMPGLYQDAKIEYSPQTQSWKLSQYKKGVPVREIEKVEVIVTAEIPVQAFLKISGTFPTGCHELGSAGIRRTSNSYNIYIYYTDESIHPPIPVACTGALRPFTRVVPLPVYDLKAGQYSYSVNGKFSGTFTLLQDNVLK